MGGLYSREHVSIQDTAETEFHEEMRGTHTVDLTDAKSFYLDDPRAAYHGHGKNTYKVYIYTDAVIDIRKYTSISNEELMALPHCFRETRDINLFLLAPLRKQCRSKKLVREQTTTTGEQVTVGKRTLAALRKAFELNLI
jgi:hypothetical protein